MTRRVLSLGLALLLGAAPAVTLGAQIEPQDPSTVIVGDDACAVLTDEELLRATGGDSVTSRVPGPQGLLPAGCAWELASQDAPAAITVYLGVAAPGGRQQYDTMVPFDDIGEPLSGVGEEAIDLGFGSLMAVEGDTAVSIQALAFGGGARPDSLVTRALAWVALTRLASEPPLLATAALAGPGVLPTDQPSLDAVAAIRTPEFGDESVTATVDLLASAGIEVVDPVTGEAVAAVSGAASPVKIMDFQARSMALEAWAGGGLSGAALDGVLSMPEDIPLTSSMLAAWLAAVDTPNARLGRALMAGQDVSDPTRLSFPMLALLLLGADIVADTRSAAAEPSASPLAAPGTAFLSAAGDGGTVRTAQGSPCVVGQTFVDDVLTTVFDALGEPVPGDVPGEVMESMWDWLSARGESFQRAAAAELTAPVIATIRDAAGLITLIGQLGAVAMPMIVNVTSNPPGLILPVTPAAPIDGEFTATVLTAGQSWPAIVSECALEAGVTLPNLTAAGHIIDWEDLKYSGPLARSPLITEGTADQALDLATPPTARFRFQSGVETPELAQGPEHKVIVSVDATVPRDDLKMGIEAIVESLYGRIPSIIRPQVEEELAPEVDDLLGELLKVVDARGVGRMSITYHTPPEPTPPPGATPAATEPAGSVWVHKSRYEAIEEATGQPYAGDAAVEDLLLVELYSCDGPYGPWEGVIRTGGINDLSGTYSFVDVVEIPVQFSFEGSDGEQTTEVSGNAQVPIAFHPEFVNIIDFPYQVDLRVDGDTMTYGGTGGSWILPIEPAPAGSCPRP